MEHMLEADRLYTVDELAAILRVHPQTVYRWLREGRIRRAVRPGRKILVLGRELLETSQRPVADGRDHGL